MTLLHALHSLAPNFGWKLSVAHFNHQLRGISSRADERLARDAARKLGLICDVAGADVRKAAAAQGVSIEMAARQLRHEFLAKCARKRGANRVALAHHAEDQVELFMLRLLRGAGGDGFGGMKPQNPSPTDKGVMLIRPFLEFSKEDICTFARSERIRFREDTSNGSVEFDRNWVRLQLLPLLRIRQPAISKTILRAMQITGAEADFVTQAAEAWRTTGKSCKREQLPRFGELHEAVQRKVIQSQIRALGIGGDFQMVEQLRTQPDRAISVGPDVGLTCDGAGLVKRIGAESKDFDEKQIIIELGKARSSRRRLVFGGLKLEWQVLQRGKGSLPKHAPGLEFFDADMAGGTIIFRHWQAGDRFQPIGLPSAVKLQDWFTNRKIPAGQRRQLVLAQDERGGLFWVEGERIGEGCKVTPNTRRLLVLRWKRV